MKIDIKTNSIVLMEMQLTTWRKNAHDLVTRDDFTFRINL